MDIAEKPTTNVGWLRYDLENRFIGVSDIIDYVVGEHRYAVYLSAGSDF